MTDFSIVQIQAVTDNYPFDRFDTIVDVGGGNGHLLVAMLEKFKDLKGTLFDLPSVVDGELARQCLARPGVAGRVRSEGGNMFVAVPAAADAYILKKVIHDWDDDQSVVILSKVREAMRPDSTLLLVEALVKPRNEPDPLKFEDLVMFATSGGVERTEAEFVSLFERSGLSLERILPVAGSLSIIEARPA